MEVHLMNTGLLTRNGVYRGTGKKLLVKGTEQRVKGKCLGLYALCSSLLVVGCVLCILCSPLAVCADDNPMNKMRDETISYFKPMAGRITKVEEQKVFVDLGKKDGVREGMRFSILREGVTFIHPVTKEPLGKLESPIGKLEIKEVNPDSSMAIIIVGEAKEGDKIRISEKQVNMLFCQSKGVDWNVADSYFRSLKETGRFDLLETDVETDDPQEVIKEAKQRNAEVALLITSKPSESGMVLSQRLFWVSDGVGFAALDTKIDATYVKDLKFGDEFFTVQKGEPFLEIDLPLGVRFLAVGDVDGNGKEELLVSTGKDVKFYVPAGELQPALGGIDIKGSGLEDHLWIDTIDLNKNGKDEIIITSMSRKPQSENVYRNGSDAVTLSSVTSGGIISCMYELQGTEFVLLYKGNVFLRKVGEQLLAQAYSEDSGFTGPVFNMIWKEGYKKGDSLNLPTGVNLYDFVYVDDPQMGRLIFAYDDDGFLNLYDKDMRLWRSKANTGGFLSTFKKSSAALSIGRGEWTMKDRLFLKNNGVLVPKRVPLVEMVKGIGYKKSQIVNFQWNGLSMEEDVLIDNIKGSLLDYAVTGDKIFVLASPAFGLGIKLENILKGENPLGSKLYIYSMIRG
jgi:hypothetical protein